MSRVSAPTYHWVQSISRRRSIRSDSTPPIRLVKRKARKRTPLISPRRKPEPVRSKTIQLSTTCWSHWPVAITTVPSLNNQ